MAAMGTIRQNDLCGESEALPRARLPRPDFKSRAPRWVCIEMALDGTCQRMLWMTGGSHFGPRTGMRLLIGSVIAGGYSGKRILPTSSRCVHRDVIHPVGDRLSLDLINDQANCFSRPSVDTPSCCFRHKQNRC